MRDLLDLMREDEEDVEFFAAVSQELLESASQQLAILDPEVGEEELIQAVAAEVAKVRAFSRRVCDRYGGHLRCINVWDPLPVVRLCRVDSAAPGKWSRMLI